MSATTAEAIRAAKLRAIAASGRKLSTLAIRLALTATIR